MNGALVWTLATARQSVLLNQASSESNQEWQRWREAAEERRDRRVPKSAEPPALVLMRDYFMVCVAGALIFAGLFYWITAWLVAGMLRTPPAGVKQT
jgi:hypothetical protein